MDSKPKLILLADDDQEDLELLSEVLLQLEDCARLHTVPNGHMVIDYLSKTADEDLPSLIVLDYNMPNMNGAEVLDVLRNNPRFARIPKVVWSTSNNSHYMNECMQKGATAYLVKPATHKNLQEQAAQMLKMSA